MTHFGESGKKEIVGAMITGGVFFDLRELHELKTKNDRTLKTL